ncbi:MAG: topoisomerase C-terminal repeat-containing protein, partial [Pseudomonadota bacterium]
ELIARKAARGAARGAAAKPMRELGEHPDGGPIGIYDGRYGPYVKWEKVNATIPKETDPQELTFDDALALIAEKAGAKGGKRKAAAKKPAAKKTAAKKPAAKKAAPKKAAPKAAAGE